MISSSSAAGSGGDSGSRIHPPRRWRRIWRPTSAKPRPRASPPRSSSEAAPLLRGRSLPPGRPNGGSSPYRPTEGTHAADHSPSCVHRPCRDHSDRCSAAARDQGAESVTCRVQNTNPLSPDATGLLRITRIEPASRRHERIRRRPGRVDPAVPRDRRARCRSVAVVELGPLTATDRPA